MGISISDLSDRAAAKALALYRIQCGGSDPPDNRSAKPGGKYGAVKAERGPLKFDSQKEARRYDALVVMLRCGEIEDLRIQPEFTLTEAYTKPSGERVRAMRYRADFSYRRGGVLIVEDVKSAATKTQIYKNKCKLMYEKYGIEVREVM